MLFAPLECSLRRLLVSNIANNLTKTAQRPCIVVKRGDRNAGEEFGPIAAHTPTALLDAAADGGAVEIGLRLARRDFLGRVEDRDMSANDLGLGPALDTFGAAVPHGYPALGVEHIYRVIGGTVDEQPEFIGIGGRATMLARPRSRRASRFHHRDFHLRLNEFVRRRTHRMTVSIAFPIDRMKLVGGMTTPLIESPFQPTCANWRSTRRSN